MGAEYFHPELIRFAFVIGVGVSILFYDQRYLTTGGIAVPAYLSFTIFFPFLAPLVFAIALATYLIVHVLVPKLIILSAGAKFSLLVLVSSSFHLFLDAALLGFSTSGEEFTLLRGIGYIVPGLIAHDFSRHGIGKTAWNIALTSLIVAFALLIAVSLLPDLSRFYPSRGVGVYPVDLRLLPLVVFLSLIAWMGLSRFRNYRCGGFLGGAFLSLLVLQPMELAMFVLTAGVTVLVVRFFIEPHAIIFGRRKFAAHLLVGACLAWAFNDLREWVLGDTTLSVLTPSLSVISVLLTGLMASDFDRVGVTRTAAGMIISVIFTLSGTLLVAELLTHQRAEIALPFMVFSAAIAAILLIERPKRDPDLA